jgi:glycosyltransferase involved in cell wall biosynthesis
MSILWIYDKPIDPMAGGTERATHLVMRAFAERRYPTAGFLIFQQDEPRDIRSANGQLVSNLYEFLKTNDVHVVVNQIGYSKWLLEEFLSRGGERWKNEGGLIITKLHFDPLMFPPELRDLVRHWLRRNPMQKLRRLGRIAILPMERRKTAQNLREAYIYLLEHSDAFVILSERHRQPLYGISGGTHCDRVHVIGNPNTFANTLLPDRVLQKSRTVLIVSRLDEPQKRLSMALRAWGKVMRMDDFSDWTLKVLGEGHYLEDYTAMITREHIHNVEFLGKVDPEPHYDEAALYLHTAKREGWGLTITEAMQKGVVPVVMRSTPVFDELISSGNDGILVSNGNVTVFAKELAMLMRSRETRERLALRAIEASHKHDADLIFEKWAALLGRLESIGNKKCNQVSG